MPEYTKPEFGAAVRRLLQEHGLSLRSQRVRTGINHMTVKDMTDGIPPRLETLEQFARAFRLDINEWRRLAGYPSIEDSRPPMERLVKAFSEAKEQAAKGELEWAAELDQLEIEAAQGRSPIPAHDLQVIRELMEEEFRAERRKQGREAEANPAADEENNP